MGRIANLPKDLYEHDLLRVARRESHACTRERLLGMAHLQKHGSLTETSKALFISMTTVQSWLNRFRENGLKGLQEKPRSGRPEKLTKEQLHELEKEIEILTSEQEGGRIKGKDIQEKIEEKFGVKYHLNALYHVLHRHKYSWITVRSKHPGSDLAEQSEFKKTSLILL